MSSGTQRQCPTKGVAPCKMTRWGEPGNRWGDLSELVHERQKVYPLSILCRNGLCFQGFAEPRKPRTRNSPPAEEPDLTDPSAAMRVPATGRRGDWVLSVSLHLSSHFLEGHFGPLSIEPTI